MERILGQILLGLTLLFGVVMMGGRLFFYLKVRDIKKVIYYSFLWIIMLFFALMSFLFVLTELKSQNIY